MEWITGAAIVALIAVYVYAYWVGYKRGKRYAYWVGYRRGKRVIEQRWREWMDKCLIYPGRDDMERKEK